MATQEQIKQAEAELAQVEEALKAARAALATATAEKESINNFYNAFVARWNTHKKHFDYLPNDALREWAVKDHEFQLEDKVIGKRYKEIDSRVEKLKEEVRASEESRVYRVRELALMKMPEGKAYHLDRQDRKIRGLS